MPTITPRNAIAEVLRQSAERREWEEKNPEIAAAWNEAREDDERRRNEAEQKARIDARRRYLRETAPQRLLALGAPQRAIDVWAVGAATTKASEALGRMREQKATFALLTGDTGVGKTCAAVAMMAETLLDDVRSDVPVLFVRATEGARMGLYDEADRKFAAQMKEADLLVIDDLGAEFVSDGSIWRTILDEVLDTRYGDRRPTVLTTNLTAEAFKARYGARIADRIRHAGVVESCGSGSLRARGEG
jgi:DNA replication protein DnaC